MYRELSILFLMGFFNLKFNSIYSYSKQIYHSNRNFYSYNEFGCLSISKRNLIRLYSGGKIREGLGKPKGYANSKLKYILENETKSGLPDKKKAYLVLGIETSCDDTGKQYGK